MLGFSIMPLLPLWHHYADNDVMPVNPYQPPGTEPGTQAKRSRRRSLWLGATMGAVVWVAYYAFFTLVIVWFQYVPTGVLARLMLAPMMPLNTFALLVFQGLNVRIGIWGFHARNILIGSLIYCTAGVLIQLVLRLVPRRRDG